LLLEIFQIPLCRNDKGHSVPAPTSKLVIRLMIPDQKSLEKIGRYWKPSRAFSSEVGRRKGNGWPKLEKFGQIGLVPIRRPSLYPLSYGSRFRDEINRPRREIQNGCGLPDDLISPIWARIGYFKFGASF
jgi:hypothetical protein